MSKLLRLRDLEYDISVNGPGGGLGVRDAQLAEDILGQVMGSAKQNQRATTIAIWNKHFEGS